MHPNVKTLVALDRDAHDLKRLQQNWQRLGLKTPVSIVHADLMAYRPKAPLMPFYLMHHARQSAPLDDTQRLNCAPFNPPDKPLC